jgi:class 3 adenylate cyclase/tetratricopeptide (TPR) repeat protein
MRFCIQCGTALARACGSCGASLKGGERFCGRCGTPVAADAATAPAVPTTAAEPAAERRLVSVLFADLVGFTTLSERRDAEEVRELLSRYFDSCRRLIELYGGTVEKFIGDAVMAVWGTPVATEDDAERAVRAGLDLVAAVSALGEEVGADMLSARAGVLTGEAAVTIGASGEGMVAGDLVNTASRVQAVAEPGAVFVGEATRRATESAIVYEDAGEHELKGKEGTTRLWRAVRVVSGRRGSLKSQGLEAPFVGRDRELRQIKDLFHVCADERRAQLVSVTGIAGIGKSRLVWEFEKYIDGLAQDVYWHRGRCLAYGEGVTYWALADMVRMRCRITEDEEAEKAVAKLRTTLEEHILDAEERRFVEPRLAQLLGLGSNEARDRQELFAAWRLFFERLAETHPTVLAFEDMQWADASLLDLVEYLLEWSRNHALYVITLARPELADRRPTWGTAHRNFTSLYLEPLSNTAMDELLQGLVPGLPTSLRAQILARAEGVPLYAVETVRMLLDRGLLVADGAAYRVAGEIEALEVPETLHALVAARLDSLSPEERAILQDAAILGKTFTPAALAAVTSVERQRLDEVLGGLVRREILGLQSDPFSPEQGQYGFLQDLLRHVAYETLPRRERRAKHLAAAEHLSAALTEDEVAEVVASHLLDAYRLDPDAPDSESLRTRAYAALIRAGERTAALGAAAEAQHHFERAAELAVAPADEAAALIRAGEMAFASADERAEALFARAGELYDAAGDTHGAARASARLGLTDGRAGRLEAAIERMERAYSVIAADEPDADAVTLLTRLGVTHWLAGNGEPAAEWTERALDVAEALQDPQALCRGWNSRSAIVSARRPEEARGLRLLALEKALAHDLYDDASFLCGNLSDLGFHRDRYAESLSYLEQALDLARRIGSRPREWFALSEMTFALYMLGRWDDALLRLAEIPVDQIGAAIDLTSVLSGVLELHLHRGELDAARGLYLAHSELGRSGDLQTRAGYLAATAALRLAEGNAREALAAAEEAFATRDALGIAAQDVKHGWLHAVEAALALGDRATADELLEVVEGLAAGLRPPFLGAEAHRFRAHLAADDNAAEREFAAAAEALSELDLTFHLAVLQLELGEWLVRRDRGADAEVQLSLAAETFVRLGARPWLERLGRSQRREHAPAAAS